LNVRRWYFKAPVGFYDGSVQSWLFKLSLPLSEKTILHIVAEEKLLQVCVFVLPDSIIPRLVQVLFFYSISLLAFFGNFFIKKYSKPQKRAKAE
jgi:hypothetical protein